MKTFADQPTLQIMREIVDLPLLQHIFAVHLVSYSYTHDKGFLKVKRGS